MKTIKLLSLHMEGFRCFKDFTLPLDGKSVTVHGANGAGKSSLMDAFLWLLTGKDSCGRANYKIFPFARDGQRNFGFSPSVEAVLDVDGQHITLRRTIVEKWAAKRGSVKKEYTGDETQYRIDDVPLSAADYATRVAALCPENLRDLLLNLNWFSEQTRDHKERRKLLMKQFGGLTQDEVIRTDAGLAPLGTLLGRHSVEEYTDICTERRKKCRTALDSLSARIDENKRQLRTLPDADALKKERSVHLVETAKLRYDIEHLSADAVGQEKKNELARVRSALAAIPAKRRIVELGADDEWRRTHDQRLEQARAEKERCNEAACRAKEEKREADAELSAAKRERDSLRGEWVSVNTQEPPSERVCPTCGQPLPEEMVRTALEKFNLAKSEQLAGIEKRGTQAAGRFTACEAAALRAQKKLDDALTVLRSSTCVYEQVLAETPPPVRPELKKQLDEEENGLKAREASLQKEIANSAGTVQETVREMQSRLDKQQARADALTAQLAEIEHNAALEKRVAELETEMRSMLCQLEEAEHGLALCQAYFAAQARMLTERINAHFSTVRFVLFETQKNGGLREICEASVDGVPYGALNAAAKRQTDLEIIQAFSESADVTMPLFIDNRESVTDIIAPGWMQIINLQVDKSAKTLQVEGA